MFVVSSEYRLAYPVWMLERIIATKTESSFFVMYDIACTLFNHLKVTVTYAYMS